MKHDSILRFCSRLLWGPILLFALYVQFHGELGPGGGFQAGLIFAAPFILQHLVFHKKNTPFLLPIPLIKIAMALGVFLFTAVGLLSLPLGAEFLNYNVLHANPKIAQHMGIFFVELGVGITVSATVLLIYTTFVNYINAKS